VQNGITITPQWRAVGDAASNDISLE